MKDEWEAADRGDLPPKPCSFCDAEFTEEEELLKPLLSTSIQHTRFVWHLTSPEETATEISLANVIHAVNSLSQRGVHLIGDPELGGDDTEVRLTFNMHSQPVQQMASVEPVVRSSAASANLIPTLTELWTFESLPQAEARRVFESEDKERGELKTLMEQHERNSTSMPPNVLERLAFFEAKGWPVRTARQEENERQKEEARRSQVQADWKLAQSSDLGVLPCRVCESKESQREPVHGRSFGRWSPILG